MSVHVQSVARNNLRARLVARPLEILREHRRTYVALNVLYFGVLLVGMVYAVFDPATQQTVMNSVGAAFAQGPFSAIGDAYINVKILPAVALTFVVNLFIGSFGTITLPSLIIPFSGLLMGVYRAFLWGLIYSPTSTQMQIILLPHSLTLILEGEAYVIAMLGVVIQGRALFSPRTVGASSHKQALWTGIKLSAQLYVLVILVLVIAAVYEVVEAALLFTVL